MPRGNRIYDHRWVDTNAKSRLTCKDLKRFTKGREDIVVNSPTPSGYANECFDFFVADRGWNVIVFDAISAFIHASEKEWDCYMYPPQEWIDKLGDKATNKVWRLMKSLYGRRTASAQFRELIEAIFESEPELELKRGHHEPCAYYSEKTDMLVVHHVDDG